MNTDEVRAAVLEMREDAYRVMTGQSAPPLESKVPDAPPRPVTLGQRVTFDYSDILRRGQRERAHFSNEPFRKEWRKTVWGKRGNVREGIIVGVRTLSNGTIDWEPDGPIQFYPETYFTAYLVAFDLRRKAVYLLPDDVEVQW